MAEIQHYFIFSNRVENLLFKDISVSSNGGIVGLCFGVALFTFMYEVMKSLRHYLVMLQMRRQNNSEPESPEHEIMNPKNIHSVLSKKPSKKFLERLKFHALQTILHMIQLTMGYMVMLIIMSYNGWLLITIMITTALCFYFHEFVLSMKSRILPVEIPGANL
ncbi:high affinity copper uptake protein 1 [Parasteatoda tepidariorum]|uniref:high affinity copper uptake protein 1 n=1 Tax=Parasteatoda tepidariorum TaxID=114398 RepID=UPI00077FB3BD|nr:high affinity copper uptake protein 1 [Parasteatoda tepidariorum]